MVLTVYFDGKCGLCSKEIRYYQKIAPKGIFAWHDIATDPAPLTDLGITQETALRRLHVTDSQGHIHQGADAFFAIWHHLKGWYWLSLIGRMPLIRQVARFGYNRFADYRFRQLPHCQIFLADK
ncbi:MAG: thiol-disulfide oxidoreductase DCC family protein [Candidatus Puniceispirillaceae bacterium]